MADFPPYLPDRVQQNEVEWTWLLQKMAGCESILEVGSCLGHSLKGFANWAVSGAKLRSIDLGFVGPDRFETGLILYDAIKSLRHMGYDAEVWIGDSHSPEAVLWAQQQGPYDFVYIDGDHSYEGVAADWDNYGHLGEMVGFHDINHDHHGVKQLWKELKELGYPMDEKVTSHQGTGLIYLDKCHTSLASRKRISTKIEPSSKARALMSTSGTKPAKV